MNLTLGRRVPRVLLLLASLVLLSACKVFDPSLLDGVAGIGKSDPSMPYERRCGNGKVEEGELCDTAIAAGEPGACVTSCPTDDPCYPQVLAGGECQEQCAGLHIIRAVQGDGCCPAGLGPADDSDCGSCGDGIIGPTETCEPPEKCPTRETCGEFSPCVHGVFSGDPSACTAKCRLITIDACVGEDGCCPSGCNAGSDNDCSASCGNGLIEAEAGETCEASSASAKCPASCDDAIACTTDLTSGSAANCNLSCAHVAVTMPASGDGCCPTGATALNDSDCPPVCGNRVVEPTELCDPCPADCDDHDTCTTDVRSGSGCSVACDHTPIAGNQNGDGCCQIGANANTDSDCSPDCGNGVVEPGEVCDGSARCVSNCTAQLPSSLTHRYGFDGDGTTLTDANGSAQGTIKNTSLQSTGVLALAGGTSDQYVDLPNGLLNGLTNATFEVWFTWSGSGTYVRIFDFGTNDSSGEGQSSSSGANFVYLTPSQGSGKARLQCKSGSGTVYSTSIDSNVNTPVNTLVHFAAVLDGSGEMLRLYMNGAQVASGSWFATPSEIANNNNWLGRSQNSSDPEFGGSIEEFRFYNVALSAAQIMNSFNLGPNP